MKTVLIKIYYITNFGVYKRLSSVEKKEAFSYPSVSFFFNEEIINVMFFFSLLFYSTLFFMTCLQFNISHRMN